MRLPMRGTLLNVLTVVVGASIGLLLGEGMPERLGDVALFGLGLVTVGLGLKSFLETQDVLAAGACVLVGGLVGALIGIDVGLNAIAEVARRQLGGGDLFVEGLVTATVLFCVGPLTLLGCIQDGLESKIELLAVKSMLDMAAAAVLAATLGVGVLVSAIAVLIIQGTLTLAAKGLRRLADSPRAMAEATAAGGVIVMALGLKLADVPTRDVGPELFLPGVVLAPALALWRERRTHAAGSL